MGLGPQFSRAPITLAVIVETEKATDALKIEILFIPSLQTSLNKRTDIGREQTESSATWLSWNMMRSGVQKECLILMHDICGIVQSQTVMLSK
jgi:hypothetical protein